MRVLLKADLMLIPIIVLTIGFLPLNGQYYTGVRFIVFIFGSVVFLGLPQDYLRERVVFLVIAIIYNPIFPIYLGSKIFWLPLNALTIWFFFKLRQELKEYGL